MKSTEELAAVLPNTRRYRSGPQFSDVAWAVVLVFVFQVVISLTTAIVFLTDGVPEPSPTVQVIIYWAVNVSVLAVTILTSYLLTCRKYRVSMRDGFSVRPVSAGALAVAAGLAVLVFGFDLVWGEFAGQQPEIVVWELDFPLGLIAVSTELLLQPFAYAAFYQGLMYFGFLNQGSVLAIFLTAFCFAATNWAGRGPVTLLVSPALLGVAMTVQTWKHDSIVPAFVTMFVHRLLAVGLLIVTFADR